MVVDGRKPVLVVCFERASGTEQITVSSVMVLIYPFTGNGIGEMQRVNVSRSKIPFNIRTRVNKAFPRFDSMECHVLKLEL